MDIIFDHQPEPICRIAESQPAVVLTADGLTPAIVRGNTSSSTTVESLVGIWAGAQERGSTGIIPFAGFSAMAVYAVPALPDFSSSRFPDIATLEEAQELHCHFAMSPSQRKFPPLASIPVHSTP